jgi:beta-alanine degradation protein BauB
MMRDTERDISAVAPGLSHVLLDNDRVKVTELRFEPGYRTPMHSHPDFVLYTFTDSRVKFIYPDGREETAEFHAGDIKYFKAVTHAAENIGENETHDMIVELKQ